MKIFKLIYKKVRFLFLSRKIVREKSKINAKRHSLIERSNRYHSGRLEIDNLLSPEIVENKRNIYNIKKQMVKDLQK